MLVGDGTGRACEMQGSGAGVGCCAGTGKLERPPRGGPEKWVSNSETAASHAGQRRTQTWRGAVEFKPMADLGLCRPTQAGWSLKLPVLEQFVL